MEGCYTVPVQYRMPDVSLFLASVVEVARIIMIDIQLGCLVAMQAVGVYLTLRGIIQCLLDFGGRASGGGP